ncbi:hypothetical protein BpHYR1_005649 [Brachionus plicatilis]|uniref:Uncharacterized protein n=1 Tax=Brachionus plicatilis TaxID=10195 RepID=A0A3M7Q240_BRAPC|nr:hypothetical protein BpHYR1_005649 [Brachionus plicatilis]
MTPSDTFMSTTDSLSNIGTSDKIIGRVCPFTLDGLLITFSKRPFSVPMYTMCSLALESMAIECQKSSSIQALVHFEFGMAAYVFCIGVYLGWRQFFVVSTRTEWFAWTLVLVVLEQTRHGSFH